MVRVVPHLLVQRSSLLRAAFPCPPAHANAQERNAQLLQDLEGLDKRFGDAASNAQNDKNPRTSAHAAVAVQREAYIAAMRRLYPAWRKQVRVSSSAPAAPFQLLAALASAADFALRAALYLSLPGCGVLLPDDSGSGVHTGYPAPQRGSSHNGPGRSRTVSAYSAVQRLPPGLVL